MGNAIRWLKLQITDIDIDTPESEAKAELCDAVDNFIREKITLADKVIASSAGEKIGNGDVILTYAKSRIVQQVLVDAYDRGTKFRVIVIDSRPLFEGRNLARALADHGLEVQYSFTHALSYVIKDVTKVFLGAHAMLSNGRLYSRVGTALVAMTAKERDIPVIVCCESVKFTDRVNLDSIVTNELGMSSKHQNMIQRLTCSTLAPPDELVLSLSDSPTTTTTTTTNTTITTAPTAPTAPSTPSTPATPLPSTSAPGLSNWRHQPNLNLLNLMYDVTPAEYIKMVITEFGSLPPSSVPVLHRMSTEKSERFF
jgi:translation initiation factor eIF-2B subunit delta